MPLQPGAERRRSLPRETAAWDTPRGHQAAAPSSKVPIMQGDLVSEALLVTVNMVDTAGVAVNGTTTHVDNVELVGGERILRAAGIGTGGSVLNGLWLVPTDPTDPWVRYRPVLHRDGLLVLVREGDARAATVGSPFVGYGGMRETMWKLVTDEPFTLGTHPIEFRQVGVQDGTKMRRTAAAPGYPVGTLVGAVPLTYAGAAPNLTSLYPAQDPLLGKIKQRYSGLYYVDFSILCGHATGGGTLAAGVWKNNIFEQEIIRRVISTADERHHGGTLVRLAGDEIDAVDIRLYDPANVGFVINITNYYTDAFLVARR